MDFTAYIERQKKIIRRRGATVLSEDGDVTVIPSREKLLSELDKMEGLNVEGRIKYGLRRQ